MSLRAIVNRETAPTAGEFAILARSLLAARGDAMMAAGLLQTWHATERVQDIAKTAVSAGGVGWGTDLENPAYTAVLAQFLATLRTVGAFDAMLPSMLNVPLRSRFSIATSGMSASTIGTASLKPLTSASFSSDEVTELKSVAVCAASTEFMRTGGTFAQAALTRELQGALAAETDAQFVAILLSGVTPVTATGTDARSVARDLQKALDGLTTSNNSRLFALMRPAMAMRLSTMCDNSGSVAFPTMTWKGGTLCGIEVVTTDAVASGAIILVDASQVVASGDTLELNTIRHGDIILSDSPDSPPLASSVWVNLWQRGMIALVAERRFTAQVMPSSGAVVEVSNAAYQDSPPP